MIRRFANLLRTARERGVGHALRLAVHRAASARWDRDLGVETAGDHLLADEGLDHPERQDHSPSSVLDLERALKLASPAPERDVFLDIGSGKGRAVLVAATRPFRRVIGVELSPHLCEVARRNVERARGRLACPDVEIVTVAAEAYAIPADVTVIYFYNPFSGSAMATVIENLRRSLAAAPRPMTVVFATPPHFERAIAKEPWVRAKAEFNGLRRHVIYECLPAGTGT